jgi:hypothetical protein
MVNPPIAVEEAQEALRAGDWGTAEGYALRLLSEDRDRGAIWLDRLAERAKYPASLGDKYAQVVLAHVETYRFAAALAPAAHSLESALQWFMRAAYQEGGEPIIEDVRYWYREARSRGYRFAEVDRSRSQVIPGVRRTL